MKTPSCVVGLLGGIGSGKSAVAGLFKEMGARVVDAYAIAHRVLREPAVRSKLVSWWGPQVAPRGRVNRSEVARRTFGSKEQTRKLNALVHPRIGEALKREIERARRRGGVLVLEAALLLETGTSRWCDVLIYVDAPARLRKERAVARGWSAADWKRREKAQWPLDRKKSRADRVIDNSGGLAATRKQVESILQEITPL